MPFKLKGKIDDTNLLAWPVAYAIPQLRYLLTGCVSLGSVRSTVVPAGIVIGGTVTGGILGVGR